VTKTRPRTFSPRLEKSPAVTVVIVGRQAVDPAVVDSSLEDGGTLTARTTMQARLSPVDERPRDPTADARRDTIERIGQPVASLRAAAADVTAPALRRLTTLLALQSARISGVLHDEASQVLAFAHMAIEDIARDAPPPVQVRLDGVRQHLHAVADQLRRVSHDLHPAIVDDLGAIDAIKFIVRAFTRATGIALAIEVDLQEPCQAGTGALVFRVVQAALANIGDHAHATAASVTITGDASEFRCTIRDDGVGFDVAAAQARGTGLGLMLIRARIEAAGGSLHIASAPRRGTCISAVIPLER
jgi:signal transduction histidine kinase